MKRLFKIGLTDSICSFMPIFMWFLLGILYDSRYSNIFTLTYAFQFIHSFLCSSIVGGSIKYEKKNKIKGHNSVYSGIFIGFWLFLIIVIGISLNIKSILNYYTLDFSVYKFVYIYGIINLVFDFLSVSLKMVLQYDGYTISAFKVVTLYYSLKVLYIFPLRLIVSDINLFMLIHILLISVTIVILYIRYLKNDVKFKFDFRLYESLKYSLSSIPSSLGMLIVYSLGIGKVTTQSDVYLASYNAVAMSTDVQWDILSSGIDTNTSIEVCEDNYESSKRKLFTNSVLYSLVLLVTSVMMMLIMYFTVKDLNLGQMFIIFMLECIWFPLYAIKYVMVSWLSLESPCKEIFIFSTLNYILRTSISLVLSSKYALSIGVSCSAIFGNTIFIILYLVKRRKDRNYIQNIA